MPRILSQCPPDTTYVTKEFARVYHLRHLELKVSRSFFIYFQTCAHFCFLMV